MTIHLLDTVFIMRASSRFTCKITNIDVTHWAPEKVMKNMKVNNKLAT